MIKLEHITCVDGVNVAYLFRSNVFHFLGSFLVIFGLLITACGGDDISDDVVISTITEPVISPSTNKDMTEKSEPQTTTPDVNNNKSKDDIEGTNTSYNSSATSQNVEDKEDNEDKEE